MAYQNYLRTDATTLEAAEVLRSSPEVLLGVGSGAVAGLSSLGISTVFDLARSATFGAAGAVLAAATDPGSVESRTGDLPDDLFVTPPPVPLASVPALGVASLRLVSAADSGGALTESLDVRTIRDLALWPPYVAARAILDEAAGDRPVGTEETPADLLPMSGRYPT
jgi:hypothetical protein